MENGLEYKVVGTEFKVDQQGEEGNYEGHFSVFGNVDDGNDISRPGMFVKTISENGHRVKVFFAHDWMKPIGPPPSILKEDQVGLFAKGKLTTGSFWGNEVWQLMKDEAITEGSFGYIPIKADFDDNGYRNLREVKLLEISPVPLGMNPLTNIRAIKSAMSHQLYIIPFVGGTLDAETEWSVKEQLEAVKNSNQMRQMFAFYDPELSPEDSKSYRFMHHLANGSVSLKGLEGAALEIMTTTDLSPSELAAAKNHLARHYKEIELTPPWLRENSGLVKVDAMLKIIAEIKSEEVLVTLDDEKRKEVVEVLENILEPLEKAADAVPPSMEHSALLDVRLREAEISLNFMN